MNSRWLAIVRAVFSAAGAPTHTGAGPLGIDYELKYDDAGIWKRSHQLDLEYAVVGTTDIGALWLGNEDALGNAFCQDIEANYFQLHEALPMDRCTRGPAALSRDRSHGGARPLADDVIGGWLVGTGVGYWSSTAKVPLVVGIAPCGLTIGISTHL